MADKVIMMANNSRQEVTSSHVLLLHIQVEDEAEKRSSTFRHHGQHCYYSVLGQLVALHLTGDVSLLAKLYTPSAFSGTE